MSLLSKEAISELRQHNLLIRDTPGFGPDHAAYPNGYRVIKPSSIVGNCLPAYEVYYDFEGKECSDAPMPVIWYQSNAWQICVHEYVPGPGPGDFKKLFPTEKQAVQFIIQYFFGETKEFSDRLEHHLRYREHLKKLQRDSAS